MANPMFTPETSTNQIYRDQDDTRCLTDDLDAIEDDVEALQSGKANTSHSHSEYALVGHTHAQADVTGLVTALEGKANASHTHNQADVTGLTTALAGKAAASHTHTQADVAGLASALAGKANASHTHDYAADDHTHTASEVGAASTNHTHSQNDVTGLATALAGKAAASHTHGQNEVTGLATTLAAKADLVDGKVPESQLPSYVSDIVEKASLSAFPATGEANKIYVAKDTNKSYRWGGTGYVELSQSVALGETSATAYRGDRGKTAYDHSQNANVHVTAAQKSAWDAKQNALSFDTTPTAGSTNPVTSGGIKSALDGKANSSHTHNYAASSHTHAQDEVTGLATALAGKAASNHTHSYNNLTDKPTIPTTLPANGGNADTVDGKHASAFALAGHLHPVQPVTTANEDLNNYSTIGVYSFAAAYQPINRPEGTSNGWLVVLPWTANAGTGTIKQIWLRHGTLGTNDHCIYVRTKVGDYGWSTWATVYTSKNPPTAAEVGAIAKALQFTSDAGGMEKVFYTTDDTNLITELEALSMGFHTVYSQAAVPGNPNATESFRCLLHKPSSNIMWVLAFGTTGSLYENYWNGGYWKGWRALYEANPSALWSGSLHMQANHTVTPSKKLSECRNGWILEWSDYDDTTSTTNDFDFVTSVIFKKGPSGQNWSGQAHYFEIPRYIGSDTATDETEERRIMKRLYVHDNKLVGYAGNNVGNRKDVVLRCVYEF